MTGEEIEAIVGGYHGDAFRILGPHALRKKGKRGAGWEVRAFLPQAASAKVLAAGEAVAMEKLHPQGFYCAILNGEPCEYRLLACLFDGREVEIDDPYRFGPILSDSDLYLHGEGTLYEGYRVFGSHLVQ